jgi:putative transcriptional regulator
MQTSNQNLASQYLLATPNVQDPLFASSLIYLCEHSTDGSMGLVINHPSDQTLGGIFEQLEIDCRDPQISEIPVLIGGPVKLEHGFVLHSSRGDWDKTINVGKGIYLTSSRDILQAIARDTGPGEFLILLGFSGWAPGQLENELQENSWLTAKPSSDITFSQDFDHKWQMAFDTLGFDLDNLSPTSGHA